MSVVFIIIQFILEVLLGSFTGESLKEDISSVKQRLIEECIKIEKELKSFYVVSENKKVK